jgi:hypothetical protein
VRRARVRNAGLSQDAARGELVVRVNERARPVEHPDAGALKARELPESRLDAVEVLRDVEPSNCNVSAFEGSDRLRGRENVEAGPASRQRGVRRCSPVGDERGEHLALSVGSDARFLLAAYHLFTGRFQLGDQRSDAIRDLVAELSYLAERTSRRIR